MRKDRIRCNFLGDFVHAIGQMLSNVSVVFNDCTLVVFSSKLIIIKFNKFILLLFTLVFILKNKFALNFKN